MPERPEESAGRRSDHVESTCDDSCMVEFTMHSRPCQEYSERTGVTTVEMRHDVDSLHGACRIGYTDYFCVCYWTSSPRTLPQIKVPLRQRSEIRGACKGMQFHS